MPLSPTVGFSAHPCKQYFKTNGVLLPMLSCALSHPTAPVRALCFLSVSCGSSCTAERLLLSPKDGAFAFLAPPPHTVYSQ